MANSMSSIARRILQKGPRVVAFRAWQAGSLQILRRVQYWSTLQRKTSAFWNTTRIRSWTSRARSNRLLIGPANLDAYRSWSVEHADQLGLVQAWAESIANGRVDIFDQEYQFDWNSVPWHTDWRWQHTWESAYYKSYNFYISNKDRPYDVKFPWELSRLSFLLPLAQAAVLDADQHWLDQITRIVTDWEQANDVAYTVSWNPMECSIRAVNLAFVVQMLAADDRTQPSHIAPLLRLLTLHGEFLYRNIEFTDVRGNHYTANIVALMLIGQTLQGIYRPARRWFRHASKRIGHEIELQYCEDGVNFEKSIAYHRLVTELFLIGLIVLDQAGLTVSSTARQRLRQACEYTRCYMRPDVRAPNWGDNDSARMLGFDHKRIRDHRSLLALAAAYFGDAGLQAAAGHTSASIPWLLGSRGVERWETRQSSAASAPAPRLFETGGIAISHRAGGYLFADVGEVGQGGRGGHGHNDLFSFELCFEGQPFIVDSGSPVYTANLHMYDGFRSTKAHNSARIDGEEIARLLGPWRIADEARPSQVAFESTLEWDSMQGTHSGYGRLADPVIHHRTLLFARHGDRLLCKDTFHCAGAHTVEQFLHFAPGISITVDGEGAHTALPNGWTVDICWSRGAQARVERSQVSENYGHTIDSQMLVLEYTIAGTTELSIDIVLGSREYR